ncbi:MAG: multicopper oxidase domain-containing protein [Burkholderiaceae bacterium]
MITTRILNSLPGTLGAGLAALLLCLGGPAHARIEGWMGTCSPDPACPAGSTRTFELTARHDFVSTSDGNSHYAWGYAPATAFPMQHPGPTLLANQGDTVKVILHNALPVPVSIIFPGQQGVTATGGNAGLLTREARAVTSAEFDTNQAVGGPTYTFVASAPGTYMYHSGTSPDLQVEMGLVGALIVRPTGFDQGSAASHPNRKAYQQAGTNYDRETLFLLTEMDPEVHWTVYTQVFGKEPIVVDTSAMRPTIWFINGRNAPDTLLADHVYWLPTQPYNALPRMHPGEKLLMRMVNAGRDLHPFHHHGNHATPIARDGRVLSSAPATLTQAPNLTSPDFTVRAVPGQTMDLIFEWTGKGVGFDVYGTVAENPHTCTPDANGYHNNPAHRNYREWCADHNIAIPVILPNQLDLSFGENWGGSPYLGALGSLPQGHPGLNTRGGYFHMWHSHNEKEVVTDDIFPGGMMTMLIIDDWSVDLETNVGGGGGPGGGGGGAPTVAFTGESGPGTLTGTTLNFGTSGGSNTLTLTISGPVTFGSVVVANTGGDSGGNPTPYTLGANTCTGSIGPGTCTITVNFNNGNGNTKTGTLTVPYTGGTGSPAVLNLTGS